MYLHHMYYIKAEIFFFFMINLKLGSFIIFIINVC